MDELTFKDISTNMRQVFESDNIMKMIFDILEKESRLNLALCCKKFYSYFQKRSKILKTSIRIPHTNYLKDIDKSFLNEILSKYKNITEIKTSFDDKELQILADANITNLEKLEISCIRTNIDPIKNMTSLKELHLTWNYQQDDVTNLSSLSNLTNLEILTMSRGKIADIEFIKELKKLKVLSISEMSIKTKDTLNKDYDFKKYPFVIVGLTPKLILPLDITPISYCTELTELTLYSLDIKSIEPIKALINLKKLDLSSIDKIEDLSIVENMVNLKYLEIYSSKINNIEPLKNLVNLEILKMRCGAVSDISPLLNLSNIKILDFPNFNIEDEQQIKIFKKIEELDFSGKYISDINSLSNFTNLKKLNLSQTKVINITPLKALVNLEELNLEKDWQCDEKEKITDIAPLSNCINLKKL